MPPRPGPGTEDYPTHSATTRLMVESDSSNLSRMKFPFKAPSLIDKTKPYFSGIKHFGVGSLGNLLADPYHTLLNMPWGRFVFLFFSTYMAQFIVFAIIFYIQGDNCILNMEGKFSRALWMSSHAASTLGFDAILPNPECVWTNLVVMIEVISASLINFIMLGLVFARFSAPFKRASTVRFSKNAVIHRHSCGYWCLSMRVANLRKHQILQPSVRMVATAAVNGVNSNYMFEHLKLEGTAQQETNLELGFPANLVHVIRPGSALYALSLAEIDMRMMEVLVFVDGIDAMTSKHMSAKTAYSAVEIHLNQMHAPLHLEMRGKQLGLDFTDYDVTVPAWVELDEMLQADVIEKGTHGLWTLRNETFKELAEKHGNGQLVPSAGQQGCKPTAAPVSDRQGSTTGRPAVEPLDKMFVPILTVKPDSTLHYGPPCATPTDDDAEPPHSNRLHVVSHSEAIAAAASMGTFSPPEEVGLFPLYEVKGAGNGALQPPNEEVFGLGPHSVDPAGWPTASGQMTGSSSSSDNTRGVSPARSILPPHLLDPDVQGAAPYATDDGYNPFSDAASGHGPGGHRIPLPTSVAPHAATIAHPAEAPDIAGNSPGFREKF